MAAAHAREPIALFADWSCGADASQRLARQALIESGYQLFQPALADLENGAPAAELRAAATPEARLVVLLRSACERFRPSLIVTKGDGVEVHAVTRVARECGVRVARLMSDGTRVSIDLIECTSAALSASALAQAFTRASASIAPAFASASSSHGPAMSVIIPTAGRPVALRRLLNALAQQTLPPSEFEVIVTDDGTEPPVEEDLNDLALPFAFKLSWQKQSGPAVARNRAIEKATGQYLMILNDDAGPAADLLEVHLRAQRAARTPRAYLGRFDFAPDCMTYLAAALTAADLLFPYGTMDRHGPNAGRFFWTCNLSVPRDVVVRAGGFDESFRLPLSEDVELGYRLEREGVHVFLLPEAKCLHHHRIDAAWFERRQIELGRHIIKLYRLHGDPAFLPWANGHPDLDEWATALEREVRNRGGRRLDLVQRIAELDGIADPSKADVVLATLLPLVRRMNEDAMRLGLVAGLRGDTNEQLTQRYRVLAPMTSLVVFLTGNYRHDRAQVIRIRRSAGTPVEMFGLLSTDDGMALNPMAGLTDSYALVAKPEETVGDLRDRVLKAAKGAYIGFLASWCEFEPDWLAKLIEPLQRNAAIGAVGPRIDGLPDPIADHEGSVARLDSSIIVARREAIEQTLLADGDKDFQERLKANGYRLAFAPEVIVRQAAEPQAIET